MFDKILAVCHAALQKADGVKDAMLDDGGISVVLNDDTSYTVSLDDADVDDDEKGDGRTLDDDDFKKPVMLVEDHMDVLDVCLCALAADPDCLAGIKDLTTDGDNKDSEAIFDTPEDGYLVLKVR